MTHSVEEPHRWASRRPGLDYAALFAATCVPYAVLSRDLVVLDVNDACVQAAGCARDELVGRRVADLFPDGERSPSYARLRESVERALRTGRPDQMGLAPLARRDDPSEVRVYSPVNVPVTDARGRTVVLHRALDVTDVVRGRTPGPGEEAGWARRLADEAELVARTRELEELNRALVEARDQLAAQALHDQLTGLLSRSVFLDELARALSGLARRPRPLAVLFVDLDRLKMVNDRYGHAAGDELVRCCAERLRSSVRPSDPVARFGGDEFVVLLDDLHDVEEASHIAARVLDALDRPCQVAPGVIVQPTASIGVAVPDSAETTADALVSHADAAMYRAKQSGRGRVELFDAAAYDAAAARLQLETELRGALRGQQLELHYQPIVDLADGRTYGVEALLRWQHPVRGLIAAGEFIDVAEESRLIVQIGGWAVGEACRQLAEWDVALGERSPERLFLNLSMAELVQPQFTEHVSRAVSEAGIEPGRLVLEITETGMVEEPRTAGGAIGSLLELGCEVAIDDFGTGYSSLSRLVQLPAHILKIDKSFVMDVRHDPEAAAVVSAVLLLAHNLRKAVVAEGVEDEGTLAALQELGCGYGQGFHLSRPLPADALTQHLIDLR